MNNHQHSVPASCPTTSPTVNRAAPVKVHSADFRGFTLIELLFTSAIVAILAAIAIPSYNSYLVKTKNNTAITDIQLIQLHLERYYTEYFRYPDSLGDMNVNLPSGGNDPWGNPYVYLNIVNGGPGIKGSVRKDHALNPINTNYDLYSKGSNGVTKTQISQKDSLDDIIVARDGGFVGLAADF